MGRVSWEPKDAEGVPASMNKMINKFFTNLKQWSVVWRSFRPRPWVSWSTAVLTTALTMTSSVDDFTNFPVTNDLDTSRGHILSYQLAKGEDNAFSPDAGLYRSCHLRGKDLTPPPLLHHQLRLHDRGTHDIRQHANDLVNNGIPVTGNEMSAKIVTFTFFCYFSLHVLFSLLIPRV